MFKKLNRLWLFNRSFILFLVILFGITMVAVFINILGIHVTGTLDNWRSYLRQNAPYFLVWRLALYALVIVGWRWVKKRLIARECSQGGLSSIVLKQRLLRIEIATIIAFIALEARGITSL